MSMSLKFRNAEIAANTPPNKDNIKLTKVNASIGKTPRLAVIA